MIRALGTLILSIFGLHSSCFRPFRLLGICRSFSMRQLKVVKAWTAWRAARRPSEEDRLQHQRAARHARHEPSGWSTAQPGFASVLGQQLSWGVVKTMLSSEMPRRRGLSAYLEVELQTTLSPHFDHRSQYQHFVQHAVWSPSACARIVCAFGAAA